MSSLHLLLGRVAVAVLLLAVMACGGNEPESPSPVSSNSAAACSGAVDWSQARSHIGQRVTISGPVVDTAYASSSRGQPAFLNVGRSYPSADRFTVVIWGSDRASFPSQPERFYRGKTICVTGTVTQYQNVPQIEVRSRSAIIVR